METPGKLRSARGSKKTDEMYKGGTIFEDHASSLVHIIHHLPFTTNKTAQVKLAFKRLAAEHGVEVSTYQADNGVFYAHEFLYHLQNQSICFSGVSVHHQNGIAERAIHLHIPNYCMQHFTSLNRLM